MNPRDMGGLLEPWMARHYQAAPDDLLLRVMAEVGTVSQQREAWPARLPRWPIRAILAGGMAIVAMAIVAIVLVVNPSVRPQPASPAEKLAALLPTALRDEHLLTHPFAEPDVPAWVRGVAARAGLGVAGYAVAYDEAIGPARNSTVENPYIWPGWDAGKNHPLRIHAILMDGSATTDTLYAAFGSSYRAEGSARLGTEDVAAECRFTRVSGRTIEWCFQPIWGEWSSWYAYASESTIYLIEGVGDIEGMEHSPVAMARLEAVLAQLP